MVVSRKREQMDMSIFDAIFLSVESAGRRFVRRSQNLAGKIGLQLERRERLCQPGLNIAFNIRTGAHFEFAQRLPVCTGEFGRRGMELFHGIRQF